MSLSLSSESQVAILHVDGSAQGVGYGWPSLSLDGSAHVGGVENFGNHLYLGGHYFRGCMAELNIETVSCRCRHCLLLSFLRRHMPDVLLSIWLLLIVWGMAITHILFFLLGLCEVCMHGPLEERHHLCGLWITFLPGNSHKIMH